MATEKIGLFFTMFPISVSAPLRNVDSFALAHLIRRFPNLLLLRNCHWQSISTIPRSRFATSELPCSSLSHRLPATWVPEQLLFPPRRPFVYALSRRRSAFQNLAGNELLAPVYCCELNLAFHRVQGLLPSPPIFLRGHDGK